MPLYTWVNSLAQTEESLLKVSRLGSLKMVHPSPFILTLGMDMSAIREIKYLQELRHENIIEVGSLDSMADGQLIDIYPSKNSLNLVLEFLDSDLEILIKDKSIIFQPADVKSWFLMLMRGLHHCHKNFILHRVPFFIYTSHS